MELMGDGPRPKAASLNPLFTYGVKPGVRGGIHFAKENTLLYACGCGISLYSHKNRSQVMIPLAEKGKHLTAIGVNKNRKLIAFAERGDRPHVVVFDLETQKRRTVLRCAEFVSHEVVSLAFSHDSKYLLAQGGAPDFSLVYFFWEKNKVITILKNLSTSKNPITEVSFHPKDRAVVCIVGQGFFRMCRLTEGILKQFGFTKAEHHAMTCHDWLSHKHVAVGTKAGKIVVLEDGELKQTVDLASMLEAQEASLATAAAAPAGSGRPSTSVVQGPPGQQQQHKEEAAKVPGEQQPVQGSDAKEIGALVTFKGGLVCSFGRKRVVVVSAKTVTKDGEDDLRFEVVDTIQLPLRNKATAGVFMSSDTASGNKVVSLAMSGSESMLVALTDTLQLMSFHLKDIVRSIGAGSGAAAGNHQQVGKAPAAPAGGLGLVPRNNSEFFSVLSSPFHNGAVTGIDVCQRKPLVVTCGSDQSICVWNYLSMELELSKEFEEAVLSVSLHPTGMYILAGFSDKLRLMNLLIDDIKTFREFNVRNCTVCAFSCGGHLLAAVSHNLISVFSSVNFRNTGNLKGHDGKVKSLIWSPDDQRLVSCAEDGSLYEWDVSLGRRVNESVIKECSYSDVTLSSEAGGRRRKAKGQPASEAGAPSGNGNPAAGTEGSISSLMSAKADQAPSQQQQQQQQKPAAVEERTGCLIYVVGSDKTIKQVRDSNLLREVDLHTITLSAVTLSYGGTMLFSGSTTGGVQSFKFPLTLPGEWIESRIHGDVVTQIKISFDDRRLISASTDGSLCFWEIKEVDEGDGDEDGLGTTRLPPPATAGAAGPDQQEAADEEYEYANEILITKSELEEKNQLVLNLQQQVNETRTEAEYQLRLKDNKFAEETRLVRKQCELEVAEMAGRISRLQLEIKTLSKAHTEELAKLQEANEEALIESAEQFKAKLIVEYQKYETLEEAHGDLRRTYEVKQRAADEAAEKRLKECEADFLRKLESNNQGVKRHLQDSEERIKAVEEMLRQTEEDADKEILELKTRYEKILRHERETNVRLRGEAGIVKKKLQTVAKDAEEHRGNIQKMGNENQKLQSSIRNMDKDIVDLKNEIRARDTAIADKEKRITDLKRNEVELGKNRFVLEHKIEELRLQILPKDEMILELQSQIDAMEDELNTVTKHQADLAVHLEEARGKLTGTASELASERKKTARLAASQTRLQKDLASMVNILQDSKALKETVGAICRKYNKVIDATAVGVTIEEESENKRALDEILRQKAFLERSVTSLKKQMEQERLNHRQECQRKVKEIRFLLEEVEALKRDLKTSKEYKATTNIGGQRRQHSTTSDGSNVSVRSRSLSRRGSAER